MHISIHLVIKQDLIFVFIRIYWINRLLWPLNALTAPWRWVLSIWSFTGNRDVSIWVKNSNWHENPQTNIIHIWNIVPFCMTILMFILRMFDYRSNHYIRIVLLSNRIIALGFLCSAFFSPAFMIRKNRKQIEIFCVESKSSLFEGHSYTIGKTTYTKSKGEILTKNIQ